jgi:hypothetical protein
VPGRSQNLTSTNCTASSAMNRNTSSPLVNMPLPCAAAGWRAHVRALLER